MLVFCLKMGQIYDAQKIGTYMIHTVKSEITVLPDLSSSDRLAKLVDALPDALLVSDQTGLVLFANHNAQALFGTGAPGLLGRTIEGIFGADNPGTVALQMARDSGGSARVNDFSLRGAEIETLSCAPIVGEGLYLFTLRYNIIPVKNDWMKRVKQALKPAQHLARVLAHEIKNPLAGIRGAAQLLAKSSLSAEDRELAQMIVNETQRVFRLIEKVNIFDDGAPQRYAPVNIHEVLAEVEKLASAGFAPHVTIVQKYDPSLPDILGHRDHLVQAILNVVKNACEAAPASGGRVVFHTRFDTAPAIHPESRMRLPVCMEIEDNGPGIHPEMRERLFEPYQTTKPQGEGLGLSIVSKIIDDHGGVIDVSSRPGKTVFKLSFPMPKRNKTS